jgi:hypothetical protein
MFPLSTGLRGVLLETPCRALLLGSWLVLAACAGADATTSPSTGAPSPSDAGLRNGDAANDKVDAVVPWGGEPSSDSSLAPVHTDGGGGASCELGAAGSFATDESLDLFGKIIYFAKDRDGNPQALPKGHYRASYEDGCMKYNNVFMWTVNASASDGWWLVGDSSADRVTLLPGTYPKLVIDGYSDFEECVNANKKLAPVEFDFGGGKLGIWLDDTPYQDNQAGESGRNPKWSLTLLEQECPPELMIF